MKISQFSGSFTNLVPFPHISVFIGWLGILKISKYAYLHCANFEIKLLKVVFIKQNKSKLSNARSLGGQCQNLSMPWVQASIVLNMHNILLTNKQISIKSNLYTFNSKNNIFFLYKFL